MSNMTAYTDVSIDPVIRSKAEKILENSKTPDLQIIDEEGEKLTSNNLNTLDVDVV